MLVDQRYIRLTNLIYQVKKIIFSITPKPLWWEWVGTLSILITASILRFWDLGARTFHHDESLHSFFSWQLSSGHGFSHNPMMHGPLQFELNAAIFFLFGDNDYNARILYATAGTILVCLPFFLRCHLGRIGSLITSLSLALSPTLLYFSRFARNDILMAVWTLALVICLWKYLSNGKTRYLYLSAIVLALAFATKETAYMVTAILGSFLIIPTIYNQFIPFKGNIDIRLNQTSTPQALIQITRSFWKCLQIRNIQLDHSFISRRSSYLLFLVMLSLPLGAATTSILQTTPFLSWSNLTFANADPAYSIGSPLGGASFIAVIIVISLIMISIYIGISWCRSRGWHYLLIFYLIWILIYTTFLTNFDGIASGMWQSLGYWVVQQDVARGDQPWYYYLVLSSIYEFFPMILGTIAIAYYIKNKDTFARFLIFWCILTFIFYTIASEKMPWLLVNITLPFIVLSGKFLGDLLTKMDWGHIRSNGGILLLIWVPLLFFTLWQGSILIVSTETNIYLGLGLLLMLMLITTSGWLMLRKTHFLTLLPFSMIPFSIILVVLTVRVGITASYSNGDVPVEMIVYTQTSPEVLNTMKRVKEMEAFSEKPLKISIDQTSGFTWPWAWYLRNSQNVQYLPLEQEIDENTFAKSSIIMLHQRNQEKIMGEQVSLPWDAEVIDHRWWFPEHTYRNLTLGKLLDNLSNRTTWRGIMAYWINREGVRDYIGSEKAIVYFEKNLSDNQ